MQSAGLARQYDQLTPRERLQLLLQAVGRADVVEVRRLAETCPTKTYRQHDAAFRGPYEAVLKVVLTFGVELAYPLGHLHMLLACRGMMPPLLVYAAAEAMEREGKAGPGEAITSAMEATKSIDQTYAACLPDTRDMLDEAHAELVHRYGGCVNGMLRGLDRFAQRVLGMDARQLLRAWLPVVLTWIEDCDLETVEPDEQWAKRAEERADEVWRALLGQ